MRRARDVIASGDSQAVVEFAVELGRRIHLLTGDLDAVKGWLRADARSRRSEESTQVEFFGRNGSVTVVFTSDVAKTKPGMSLRDAEVNLPPETFAKLFVKEVVVRPADDFLDQLSTLSEAERSTVSKFIEVIPATPKVYLPR